MSGLNYAVRWCCWNDLHDPCLLHSAANLMPKGLHEVKVQTRAA
jgi:hypothetical protein